MSESVYAYLFASSAGCQHSSQETGSHEQGGGSDDDDDDEDEEEGDVTVLRQRTRPPGPVWRK